MKKIKLILGSTTSIFGLLLASSEAQHFDTQLAGNILGMILFAVPTIKYIKNREQIQ